MGRACQAHSHDIRDRQSGWTQGTAMYLPVPPMHPREPPALSPSGGERSEHRSFRHLTRSGREVARLRVLSMFLGAWLGGPVWRMETSGLAPIPIKPSSGMWGWCPVQAVLHSNGLPSTKQPSRAGHSARHLYPCPPLVS